MWSDGDYSAEPSMAENLAQHLQAHQALLANPAARAMLTPETLQAAEAHVSKTIQLAQMQAAIQSMQQKAGPQGAPAVGEQAQNAQIGRMEGQNGAAGPGQPAQAGPGVGMPQPGGMARG